MAAATLGYVFNGNLTLQNTDDFLAARGITWPSPHL